MFMISLAYIDVCMYANEIVNIYNKDPNSQINIENQHLGKYRDRGGGGGGARTAPTPSAARSFALHKSQNVLLV